MAKKKPIWIAAGIILALWIAVGVIDFSRVFQFEPPIFCIASQTADDGGSGHYIGLGYSFDLKGNFMPEDDPKGVTEYRYSLFGIQVRSAVRD